MESNSSLTATCDNRVPLLSVIVPVFNVAPWLSECMESILSQSYDNIEVLLIDDGSSDGSELMCDAYMAGDARVRTVHRSNAGLGAARNCGLELCHGQYITFVDSDDKISCDAWEPNIELLESDPETDFVQYEYCRWFGGERIEPATPSQPCGTISRVTDKYIDAFDRYILRSYMPNKIFRREMFAALRFNEWILFEDRALLPDLLDISRTIRYSPFGLYYYRVRENQITAQCDSNFRSESQITANLAIVRHALRYRELRSIALSRYNDCIYFCRKGGERLRDEVAAACPPVGIVLGVRCAIGLKLKCLIMYICPRLLI